MPRRRSDIDADLEALYAQIPDVDCKGKCHTSCGPIRMSDRERSRIRQTHHITIPNSTGHDYPPGQVPSCVALTEDRKCAVYELRPMICRLWGAVEGMPCTYGCKPKDGRRLLEDEEAYVLIAEALRIGGGRGKELTREEIEAKLGDVQALRPVLRSMVARGQAEDEARSRAAHRLGTFGSGR